MNIEILFRIIYFVVFFITIFISAHYRRKARKEGETIKRNQEGFIILFARMSLGCTLLFFILSYPLYPGLLEWSIIPLSFWLRWAGVLVALACPFLSLWLFKNIGSNISETVLTKQDHQLVTSGPYKYIRHPLYTTGILLILSLGVISQNWVLLLLAPITFLIFRLIVIPKEEIRLIEKFGENYTTYRKTTGALFPKI